MISLSSTLSSLFSLIAGDGDKNIELTATSEKTKMMSTYCYFNDYKKSGKDILFTTVEQKSLSNVNNQYS